MEPNFTKTAENDVLDVGWYEGTFSDGRPFRTECWCQDQVTMITFFFSTIDLENASQGEIAGLLVSENLVRFNSDKRYLAARRFVDPSGNEMWSINIVVGDGETVFLEDRVLFKAYPGRG